MHRLLKRLRDERAQAAVEFALVAPILVFLALSVLQFGIDVNAKMAVADAAREGARVMSIEYAQNPGQYAQDTATAVQTDLQGGGLQVSPSTYNPQWPYTSGSLIEQANLLASPPTANVTVSYNMQNYAPLLPMLFGQPADSPYITLTSTASFMIEQ